MYKKFLFPILFFGALSLASCSENEPEISDDSAAEVAENGQDATDDGEQDADDGEQEVTIQDKNEVTVYSDGTTSTGVPFRRINYTTFWINYIEYQINQGHIEVIGHDCTELADSLNGEVEIYSAITIDETTYPVRVIDYWAHYDNYHDDYSRSCPNLKKITIPNSVVTLNTSFGNGTFQDCSNLEEVLLSNNLTTLPNYCFSDCSSLKKITFPDNLTTIGIYCFSGCGSLKEITLPDNLTTLGYSCFYGCSSLERITLPDNLTSLGSSCFYGCSSLKEITLPDNLTSLGEYCFRGCSELKKLAIPGSVTSIGEYCFYGCNSLARLSFADTFPQMYYSSYPTDIRSLISFGDKLWIYRNENKKLYTTIVDPEEFNAFIYEMYRKGVFSSLYNRYAWWSASFLCDWFFTIYVPESALSDYRSYSSELSPWFEGYDPATFDFEALLAD